MVQVYFATNRMAAAGNPNTFDSELVAFDPNAITYAVAEISVDLASACGTVNAITDRSAGQFSEVALTAIVGADRNLLVFIHGFDNTFEDGLIRAALNAEFYRSSGKPAADTVVIAFCWPSLGKVISLGHAVDAAYVRDQSFAGSSGFHLQFFLAEIDRVRGTCQASDPKRRVFLLVHSMGNWVLQAGITRWFQAHEPAVNVFDDVFLAAADEQADTFAQVDGLRLGHLRDVANRITIYFSRNDAILGISTGINRNMRLGFDGPDNRTNTVMFPPNLFRMIDCTDVHDFSHPFLSLESHQYYRLSPTIRDDIASVMALSAPTAGGAVRLAAPALGV